MREGGHELDFIKLIIFTYALVEVDRILPRNDVGDGGASGGGLFRSRLGGGSFGRHGCCKFPEGVMLVFVDEVGGYSGFVRV